jgi:hypothetical protein
VWLTSETDPRAISVRSLAQRLDKQNRAAHLIWDPGSGEMVQLLPVMRAGRLLCGDVGREGRICVQIMVIGRAQDPFTDGPMVGLDSIMPWLDAWGVSRRWPAGPPLPSPQSYHSGRHRRPWARGGHFGCSQVPETTGPDPGGVDVRRITGPNTPIAEIPRPRAAPLSETMAEATTEARLKAAGPAPPGLLPRLACQPFEPFPEPANSHS